MPYDPTNEWMEEVNRASSQGDAPIEHVFNGHCTIRITGAEVVSRPVNPGEFKRTFVVEDDWSEEGRG